MTTASDPDAFRYQRVVNALAHAQPVLWFIAAGSAVLEVFVGDLGSFSGAMTLALLVSIVAGWKHTRSLCERCAKNTPLDTDAAIERDGYWLQWAHWHADHPRKAALILFGLIGLECMPFRPLSVSANVVLSILLGALVFCQLKHRVLQPWCPQCRWNGGGDEEVAPEPVPPSVQADR